MFNECEWENHKGRSDLYPIVSNRYLFGKAASLLTDHQAKGCA